MGERSRSDRGVKITGMALNAMPVSLPEITYSASDDYAAASGSS
jgi:hypothetical protein